MKIYLSVRNAGTDDKTTLYFSDLPDMNVWIPEGSTASIPFGDGEDGGLTERVARCYFGIAEHEIRAELNEVLLDAPESWGIINRSVSNWRHETFDGTDRTPEEFSRYVHASLLQGGWKRYGE